MGLLMNHTFNNSHIEGRLCNCIPKRIHNFLPGPLCDFRVSLNCPLLHLYIFTSESGIKCSH
jgi:hypothetical protein